MRKYWTFYVLDLQNTLAFRGPLIVWAIGSLVSLVATIAFWFAASGGETFGGYTRNELVTYYILALMLQWINGWMPFYWLKDQIKDGTVVGSTLVKPISLFTRAFAGEAGWHTISAPIGILVGAGVLYFLQNNFIFSLDTARIFLILIATLESIFIICSSSLCMSLLAFWFTNINTLDGLYWSLRFIIGGQVLPISFLTGYLHSLAIVLPFRYMVSFPLEIYFDKLSRPDLLLGFTIATGWCLMFYFLYRVMLTQGLKIYSSFGN